jgi:hypothetical protein
MLRSGNSLLGLPIRDLVDTAFRLFVEWHSMTEQQMDRYNNILRYFRDRETEFETGEIVLPSWASIGNVAANYGADVADPFAAPTELPPTDETSE